MNIFFRFKNKEKNNLIRFNFEKKNDKLDNKKNFAWFSTFDEKQFRTHLEQ
jgi:hypothetical protein